MAEQEPLRGRCACGAVRYQLTRVPMFVHGCHCTWCQRETGTAFAINALIETAAVAVSAGEVEAVVTPSASGKGQTIVRCASCRVALWSHYAGGGEKLSFVRVGTLEEPGRWPPDIHIYTSTKLPWVVLPADATVVPEYYRASEHWPAASLERARLLRG